MDGTGDGATRKKRPGRDATTARILDAAQELFAKHGPGAVSVRQVASKAGVSHAIVHRYIGSKDDLIQAVLSRVDTRRTATAKEAASLREVYRTLLPTVMQQRDHSMMLVRAAMEGSAFASQAQQIKTTAAMVELARKTAASGADPLPPPADIDPRVLVSAISAMVLGWASIEDWVWPTAGLDPADKPEVYRQLIEVVGYLADLTLVRAQ